MNNDHVVRVNTKTGEVTEYLLPRATNIRRVNVDNSTNPPTFWVGNNLGASIVKVEPVVEQVGAQTQSSLSKTTGCKASQVAMPRYRVVLR